MNWAKLKQTEIGEIPEDWEVKNTEEILLLEKGSLKIGPFGSQLKKEFLVPDGFKLYGQENIFKNDFKLGDRFITKERFELLESCELKPGDLIISMMGTVGFVQIVPENIQEGIMDSHLLRLRIDEKKMNKKFILYAFRSKTLQNQIDSLSVGTIMSGLSSKVIKMLLFPCPPLIEQTILAKILTDFDSKIELNYQMNKTIEAIGQALFKHWFIDFEFPDKGGKPYKSSGGEIVYSEELEKEIPKGWEVKPIDKIAHFLNGLALQKYPVTGDEYLPVIKIREMKQGITENTDKASPNIPEEYVVNDGDILFSWSGSLGICIWGRGKGALNQHLFKVTSDKYPKWFYYYWIKQYLPKFIHIAAGKATTMGHIKRNHLSESFVVIPPNQMIEKLNNLITPTFNKIIENSIELRNLELIRDTILPKLMSGKIRVNLNEVENKKNVGEEVT